MSNTAPTAQRDIDLVPANSWTPAEKAAFAALAAEARSAAYLNSIRKMMVFFVILTVILIIGSVVFGLLEWNAINSLKPSTPSNPFG